jgi:hypothetical protein
MSTRLAHIKLLGQVPGVESIRAAKVQDAARTKNPIELPQHLDIMS